MVLFKYVNFGKISEPKVSGVDLTIIFTVNIHIPALELDLAKILFLGWLLTKPTLAVLNDSTTEDVGKHDFSNQYQGRFQNYPTL